MHVLAIAYNESNRLSFTYSSFGCDNSLSTGNKNGVCAKHCITALKKHVLPKLDKPRTRGNCSMVDVCVANTRFAWPGIKLFELNEFTMQIVLPSSERIDSTFMLGPSTSSNRMSPLTIFDFVGVSLFDARSNSFLTNSKHCDSFLSFPSTFASQS